MESVPLCKVTTIVTWIQDYCWGHRGRIQSILLAPSRKKIVPLSLYCLYLWRNSLAWSCFAHDLMWWARQLVDAGGDWVSSKSPQRPYPKRPEEGAVDNKLSAAIPRQLPKDSCLKKALPQNDIDDAASGQCYIASGCIISIIIGQDGKRELLGNSLWSLQPRDWP